MKNSVTDKVLKISIIIAILLIGFSVFYYFVIFQPSKQREASLQAAQKIQTENEKYNLEMQLKCRNSGEKLFQEEQDDRIPVIQPHYHYNSKLNLCLYQATHMDGYPQGASFPNFRIFIENGFTGELILLYVQNGSDPEKVINEKRDKFDKQRDELFESSSF